MNERVPNELSVCGSSQKDDDEKGLKERGKSVLSICTKPTSSLSGCTLSLSLSCKHRYLFPQLEIKKSSGAYDLFGTKRPEEQI
jgi:hypothetical protein